MPHEMRGGGRMMGGDDQESASLMGAEPDRAPSTVESVNIRPAENGGFIVTCSKKGTETDGNMPSGYSSKDYAFGSLGEVQQYLASELGAPAVASPDPMLEPEPDDADEMMA